MNTRTSVARWGLRVGRASCEIHCPRLIRLAKTYRGDFPVRVVDGDRALTGLGCTRRVFENEGAVREISLVHLEPIDIVPHRVLTLSAGFSTAWAVNP